MGSGGWGKAVCLGQGLDVNANAVDGPFEVLFDESWLAITIVCNSAVSKTLGCFAHRLNVGTRQTLGHCHKLIYAQARRGLNAIEALEE